MTLYHLKNPQFEDKIKEITKDSSAENLHKVHVKNSKKGKGYSWTEK